LKRLRPALGAVGIRHTPPTKGDKRRIHVLELTGNSSPTTPTTPTNPAGEPESTIFDPPKVGDDVGDESAKARQRPNHRPSETCDFPKETANMGDEGDKNPHNSACDENGEVEAENSANDDWGTI
jgi:hypothetical protein